MDAIEHPEIWEFGPSMDPGPFFFVKQEPYIIGVHGSLHQDHQVFGIRTPLLSARAMEKGKSYGKDKGNIIIGIR